MPCHSIRLDRKQCCHGNINMVGKAGTIRLSQKVASSAAGVFGGLPSSIRSVGLACLHTIVSIAILLADLVLLQAAWESYIFSVDRVMVRLRASARFRESLNCQAVSRSIGGLGGVIGERHAFMQSPPLRSSLPKATKVLGSCRNPIH